MAKLTDTATGFAFGALSVLAIGCSCWLYFTDIFLTHYETGDRGLGLWGTLGVPSAWIAWIVGSTGVLGLSLRRFERTSTVAIIAPLIYLGLFSFVLFARWCRPMWRVM